MPTKPISRTMNATTADILNAVRNTSSDYYRSVVPVAYSTRNNENNFREIGATLTQYPALMNESLHNLVNRIGLVILQSKMYGNPWKMFKRGILEHGETIEEIFINIAKPNQYDPGVAEREVEKRVPADVLATYHVLNYQKFYKATVEEATYRQAFLSRDGVSNFIKGLIESMYSAMEIDEFLVAKYLIALEILNGGFHVVTIPQIDAITEDTARHVVAAIKGTSSSMEFPSTAYNRAGVVNFSKKDNQFIIINAAFDATMDVNVLATSFNINNAEFFGKRVTVDGFGMLDNDRLGYLFAEDTNYIEISREDMEKLNKIPAVLVDRDWFMIFDNLVEFHERFNEQGLYWNYWLHNWKTLSSSPYANAVAFVPGEPSVTSVEISPAAITTKAGQEVKLTAVVDTVNFAPKKVIWATSDETNAPVNENGSVKLTASASGTITITATSDFDETKTGTATITIG